MCTLDCVERLLVNLKVVAKIPPGGRIVTHYDRIELDAETLYQPLLRWWRGQSRDRAIEELKRTYQHAMQLTTVSTPSAPAEIMILGVRHPQHTLHALRQELHHSLQGLQNLKNTYADDVTMQSKLQLLVEEVTTHLGLDGPGGPDVTPSARKASNGGSPFTTPLSASPPDPTRLDDNDSGESSAAAAPGLALIEAAASPKTSSTAGAYGRMMADPVLSVPTTAAKSRPHR